MLETMQILSLRLVAALRVATLPTDDFAALVEFEITAILQPLFEHLPSAAYPGFHSGKTQPKARGDLGYSKILPTRKAGAERGRRPAVLSCSESSRRAPRHGSRSLRPSIRLSGRLEVAHSDGVCGNNQSTLGGRCGTARLPGGRLRGAMRASGRSLTTFPG